MKPIPKTYFQNEDTLWLCRDLLGKCLVTSIGSKKVSGLIIETEGYLGVADKACHAYGGRRTKRTEVMYSEGGVAYVYVCYGMHHLFNIVTHRCGEPHAILIRALLPLEGREVMAERRGKMIESRELTAGPAMVCQALGITLEHSGERLDGSTLWLEDRGIKVKKAHIMTSPRIGIPYAGEFVDKPWRFVWTQPKKCI